MSPNAIGLLACLLSALAGPVMLFFFSRFSGWQDLAQAYPCNGDLPRPRHWMGYAVFRGWLGYNGGLTVAADEHGLFIAPLPIILSFCHDPIFIPWPEMAEIRPKKKWNGLVYEIHTRRLPDLQFALRDRTFQKVLGKAQAAKVPGL